MALRLGGKERRSGGYLELLLRRPLDVVVMSSYESPALESSSLRLPVKRGIEVMLQIGVL